MDIVLRMNSSHYMSRSSLLSQKICTTTWMSMLNIQHKYIQSPMFMLLA